MHLTIYYILILQNTPLSYSTPKGAKRMNLGRVDIRIGLHWNWFVGNQVIHSFLPPVIQEIFIEHPGSQALF